LALKIVENAASQETNNVKVDTNNNIEEPTFQIVELPAKPKDEEKVAEVVDFDAMDMNE